MNLITHNRFVTICTMSISSRYIKVFTVIDSVTGNLCVPILNWNNAFLKCSGRISVYFSFPCEYLKNLYIILLLSIASHVILLCQSCLNWSHSHLCTLLLSTLKSCVAQIIITHAIILNFFINTLNPA